MVQEGCRRLSRLLRQGLQDARRGTARGLGKGTPQPDHRPQVDLGRGRVAQSDHDWSRPGERDLPPELQVRRAEGKQPQDAGARQDRRALADHGRKERLMRRVVLTLLLSWAALAAAATPEDRLSKVFESIEANRVDEALTRVDALIRDHPNFRLAHLVRGDLLLARTRPLQTFGNVVKTVPPEKIDGLRA